MASDLGNAKARFYDRMGRRWASRRSVAVAFRNAECRRARCRGSRVPKREGFTLPFWERSTNSLPGIGERLLFLAMGSGVWDSVGSCGGGGQSVVLEKERVVRFSCGGRQRSIRKE